MIVVLVKLFTSVFLSISFFFLHGKIIPLKYCLALNFIFKFFIYILVYIILELPHTADLISFYIPSGKLVLDGKIPGRDFIQSYGIIFPYLFGYIDKILGLDGWYIFLLIADTLILRILINSGRGDTARTNDIFWFWILNPLIIWITVINGQQQILIALFGVLAVLMYKNNYVRSLFLIIIASLVTKILAFVYLPVILLRDTIKRFSITILSLLSIFIFCELLFGSNIYIGIKNEVNIITPGSIFYWLEILFNNKLYVSILNFLSILISVSLIIYIYVHGALIDNLQTRAGIALILLTSYFILGPRIYAAYYVLLLPIILICYLNFKLDIYFLFIAMMLSVMTSIEGSLFFRIGQPVNISNYNIFSFLGMFIADFFIMICDLYIIITIVKKLLQYNNKNTSSSIVSP